jgi:hypothetical protein
LWYRDIMSVSWAMSVSFAGRSSDGKEHFDGAMVEPVADWRLGVLLVQLPLAAVDLPWEKWVGAMLRMDCYVCMFNVCWSKLNGGIVK